MPIEFAFLDYLQTLHTPLLDELMLFITTMAGLASSKSPHYFPGNISAQRAYR